MTYKEKMAWYKAECEEISDQCVEEGYPSYGSNYGLRVEQLDKKLEISGFWEDDDE